MKFRHDLASLGQRLAALVGRRRRDRDVEDEVAFHLAMRQADHARAGVSPEEAARLARRQFGNVAVIKEQTREMWRFPSMESIMQDIRYALRALRRAPAFSIVAVLVLAIGIGANVAIFSLIDAMLFRGLPYPDADRLVLLIGNVQRTTVERRGNSYPDHADWRAKSTRFDDTAAYSNFTVTLSGADEPERIPVEAVTWPYFSVLGVAPIKGRTFRADEDVPGSTVAVLSHGLWTRRFGADPSIVDKPVLIGGRPYTVIGVMPQGFAGVSDGVQLWLPFPAAGAPLDNRGSRGFFSVARLKKGATIDEASAELAVISAQLEASYPATNAKRGVEVSPLGTYTYGNLQSIVFTLMAAVSFVLLIACANVANLLIGRSEVRQKEIAVRTALGAGHGRLMRQLITESCVLTFLGAAAGVVLAHYGVRALISASPVTFPSFIHPTLSLPVLAFTVGLAIVSGVLLGLAPAMHARLSRLTSALKESARGTGGVRSQRLRASLVVIEVALAIVLLVGAGLMIRTMQKLTAIDPGFDASHVLSLSVSIPRQPAPPGAAPNQPPPPLVLSGRDLVERVRAVPGVASVSLASDIPLGPNASASFYTAEGDQTSDAQTMPRTYVHRVGAEFFQTLRIPIKAGRAFTDQDSTPDNTSVIVSENVVRRFWPGQDAIGKRVKIGAPDSPNPWLTIVGVVGELKYRGLPANPTADPDMYFPALDRSPNSLVIRTNVDPDSITGAVRTAIRNGLPAIVVYGTSSMDALVTSQTSSSRFTTWLLGLFAATALVLSMIGLYGVMSYLVAQRTREFGIRLALGATRTGIVSVVLRHGAKLIAIGAVLGAIGTIGLSKLMEGLLYGIEPFDASAFVAMGMLIAVALLACAIPALRATRVDPVVALRSE